VTTPHRRPKLRKPELPWWYAVAREGWTLEDERLLELRRLYGALALPPANWAEPDHGQTPAT
jgi:hypothetical protein